MKLLLASDLHLDRLPDFCSEQIVGQLARAADAHEVDLVALVGDLTNRVSRPRDYPLLAKLATDKRHVVAVLGNHDCWSHTPEEALEASKKYATEAQARGLNFHVLELESLTLQDGRRLHAATLWFPRTAYSEAHQDWIDFRLVLGGSPPIHAAFEAARKFLDASVNPGDIVLTHHLPSMGSVAVQYAGNRNNAFYVADCEDIIRRRKPALWVHGHVHHSVDYKIGKTRVVSNPRGHDRYDGGLENSHYNPERIIEL